ncbi:DUF2510 domain-containing protein [Nocardia vinacea]|uniref:DUF2510 domain-containing protein n=1 Tax=Nocardia vinacea TaxID=96468 RepID=UPI003AF35F90
MRIGYGRISTRETVTTARGIIMTVPPNWYPDPQHEGFLRYWNGTEWTGDRAPAGSSALPSPRGAIH